MPDRLTTVKKRRDFLRARSGYRARTFAFALEAIQQPDAETNAGSTLPPQARFGFTVTKKLGNAVTRNRIKRRLKNAVRTANPGLKRAGFDYILIAYADAGTRPFADVVTALEQALTDIRDQIDAGPPKPRRRRAGKRSMR